MHVSFMVLMTISLTSVYSFTSNSSHTSRDKLGCFLNSSKSNSENGGKVAALSIKSVIRHSRISCCLGWSLRVFTIVELNNAGLRWL
uniref:Secreted protein n=1 Tax=Rhipicephalus appendiculatus TaxID=34631 RepID=A0A131YGK7_RHIAP